MRKFNVLVVSAMGLVGTAVVAMADPAPAGVSTSSTAAQPAPTTASDADKIVCQSEPPTTGTRLGARRVCMSQHQWDDMRREQQANINQTQTRGFQSGVPGH